MPKKDLNHLVSPYPLNLGGEDSPVFLGIHTQIRAAKSKIHAEPPQASSLCACLFQECVLKLSGSRTPGKCPQLGTGRAIEISFRERGNRALVIVL